MYDYKLNKTNVTGKKLLMIEQDAGYIKTDNEHFNKFVNEVSKLDEGKSIITEPLVLIAVLQKHSVENKNGRIYPEDILKNQVHEYQTLIKEKRALGELEHPETSIIDSDRVSHNVIETWWEGKTLLGKLEILMSPGFINSGIISCKGDLVANYIRKGIRLGVSSRGVGSLENMNGKNIVQEDYEIICWDVVVNPSTPGSWMFTDVNQAKPFTESKQKNNNFLSEKLNKFLIK